MSVYSLCLLSSYESPLRILVVTSKGARLRRQPLRKARKNKKARAKGKSASPPRLAGVTKANAGLETGAPSKSTERMQD